MKKIFKLMLHALEPINPKSIFLANFDDIKKNSGKLKKLNSEEREMLTEPTRVFRRQFILSHATLADSSNWR